MPVFRTSEHVDVAGNDFLTLKNTIDAANAFASNNSDSIVTVILDSDVYIINNNTGASVHSGIVIGSRVHIDSTAQALIRNSCSYTSDGSTYQYGVTFVPSGDDISIRNIRFEAVGDKPGVDQTTPPLGGTSYGNQTKSLAIYQISGGSRFVVDNCEFTNYPVAIYFSGNAQNSIIQGNYDLPTQIRITNNIFHGGNGLLLRLFNELLFEGNMSDKITDSTTDPYHQLYVADRDEKRSGALVVSNCIDYNTQGVGESWKIRNVSNVVVMGCNSFLASRGIVADSCDNVTISSCHIGELRPGHGPTGAKDTEAAGIALWDCPNSIVSDCVVSTSEDVICYRVRHTASVILGVILPNQDGLPTDQNQIRLPVAFANALKNRWAPKRSWTPNDKVSIKIYEGTGAGQIAYITDIATDSDGHATGPATLSQQLSVNDTSYIGCYDPINENNIFRNCTAVVTQKATSQQDRYRWAAFAVDGGGNVSIESPTIFYRSEVVSAQAFYCTNAHNVVIDRPHVFVQPQADWTYHDVFIRLTNTVWDCLVLLDRKLLPQNVLDEGLILGSASNKFYNLPTLTSNGALGTPTEPLSEVDARLFRAFSPDYSKSSSLTWNSLQLSSSSQSVAFIQAPDPLRFYVVDSQGNAKYPARLTSNGLEILNGFFLYRSVAVVLLTETYVELTATHNIIVGTLIAQGVNAVRLPAALLGKECTVRNHTNGTIKVYPPANGQLNVANNVPVSMETQTTMTFVGQSSNQWYS